MSKATPEDDQRKAKVKADIRALDAAIDTAFFGANPGPSTRAVADVSRSRNGSRDAGEGNGAIGAVRGGGLGAGRSGVKGKGPGENDFDGSDDIPLRKSSPLSFTSTPRHYESLPDPGPRYNNQYELEEPVTLARRLFFYGFLFFPFWIAGFCILFAKPRQGEWVATDATPAEQERLIVALRQTEVKWARRCGFAIVLLVIIVVAVVLIVQFTTRPS